MYVLEEAFILYVIYSDENCLDFHRGPYRHVLCPGMLLYCYCWVFLAFSFPVPLATFLRDSFLNWMTKLQKTEIFLLLFLIHDVKLLKASGQLQKEYL